MAELFKCCKVCFQHNPLCPKTRADANVLRAWSIQHWSIQKLSIPCRLIGNFLNNFLRQISLRCPIEEHSDLQATAVWMNIDHYSDSNCAKNFLFFKKLSSLWNKKRQNYGFIQLKYSIFLLKPCRKIGEQSDPQKRYKFEVIIKNLRKSTMHSYYSSW